MNLKSLNIIVNYITNPTHLQLVIIVFFTGLSLLITRRFLLLLQSEFFGRSIHRFSAALLKVYHWVILSYSSLLFLQNVLSKYNIKPYANKIWQAKLILLIMILLYVLQIWRKIYTDVWLEKNKNSSFDLSVGLGISKISSIAMTIFACFVVLDIIGVPLSTLYAFGGIGGLGVSLAAKDMIANFFGGFMVFIQRPFMLDDWVVFPEKGIEGVVEEIGWYRTKILTFERRPMYIPNSWIVSALIENAGRMYNRRIKQVIPLKYEDLPKIPMILETMRNYLNEHPAIDKKQSVWAHLISYKTYYLEIDICCFTKTVDSKQFRNEQEEILLGLASIIKQHGASFATALNVSVAA